MTRNLPRPVTANDEFMAAAVDLLATQNQLLTEIRDRLPNTPDGGGQPEPADSDPQPEPEPEPVEIREPAPKRTPAKKTAPRRAKPTETEQ